MIYDVREVELFVTVQSEQDCHKIMSPVLGILSTFCLLGIAFDIYFCYSVQSWYLP